MRKPVIFWLAAVLGLGSLSGCGWFDSWREPSAGASRISTGIASPYYRTTVVRPATGPSSLPERLPDRLPAVPRLVPLPASSVSSDAIEVVMPVDEQKAEKAPIVREENKTVEQAKIIDDTESSTGLKAASLKQDQMEKYKSVVGQVQAYRNSWRLRYASIEQDDPHGGSVTLEGDMSFESLRDGMTIRVRGSLIPAMDRSSGARYRVQSFEVVE